MLCAWSPRCDSSPQSALAASSARLISPSEGAASHRSGVTAVRRAESLRCDHDDVRVTRAVVGARAFIQNGSDDGLRLGLPPAGGAAPVHRDVFVACASPHTALQRLGTVTQQPRPAPEVMPSSRRGVWAYPYATERLGCSPAVWLHPALWHLPWPLLARGRRAQIRRARGCAAAADTKCVQTFGLHKVERRDRRE